MHVLCHSAYQNVSMLTGEEFCYWYCACVRTVCVRVLQNNSKRREIEEIK